MSRINQLSQCLVEKYDLSEQEANEFVTTLFELIRENLLRDNIVKVKGLGTFKLAEMSARESVDVNTGERITIEGRNKLSFTPENAVRDRINSPFSSFESIDLDEEIDFSPIDRKYENASADTAKKEVPPVVAEEPVSMEISAEEPSAVVPSAVVPIAGVTEVAAEERIEVQTEEHPLEVPAEEIAPEEPADEMPAEEVPVEEPAEEPAVATAVDEVSVVEEPVEEVTQGETADVPVEADSAEEPSSMVRAPFCEELIRTDMDHSKTIITLLRWLLGLVSVLIICVGGYMAYNIGRDSGLIDKFLKPEPTQTEAKIQTEGNIPAAVDSTMVEDTVAKSNKHEQDTVVKVAVEPVVEKKQNEIPDQTLYNKDVRVRTGAYYIMGLDQVITIQQGQTFAGICKAYLGEGMECYVEVFNDGITDAKPGDKIKIPKVKPKKSFRKK